MPAAPAIVESPGAAGRALSLAGSSFDAWHLDDGYWHLVLSLRRIDGTHVAFVSRDTNVAPLFDVYSIDIEPSTVRPSAWRELDAPFQIESIQAMWREEWLVPGATHLTIGDNPHTLFVGPSDSVPPGAVASAQVLAGWLFSDGFNRQLAVVSSPSAPLNVDFHFDADAVSAVISAHTIRGVGV